MATRFHIDAIFKAVDKFSAPVARMTTRMSRFTRATRRGLKGITRNAKRMMRGMRSAALTVGSLLAAAAIGLRGLMRPTVAFEHAIAGINAKTRGAIAAEGRLNEIREKALYLGERTVFTSTQVAEAMQDLAKAGLTTTEILGGIEPILHAAGAEGAGIADVAKVIISTMKAFDKEMNLENTTRTADIMANVAASAKTSVVELAEGVSKFAPVAHMFGFALPDTVAFVAALQDVGIEASMSGTQLKTMFSKLSNLSPKARKEFKKLGIDVREALEAGDAPKVIMQIMEGLEKATSKAQKVRAMTAAFGQRGMIASMLLTTSQGKKSGGLLDLLEAAGPAAAGAAREMYGIQQATTKGAFTELSSAWETFRIKVGEGALPAMKGLADSVADILRDPKVIKKFAGYITSAVGGMQSFWKNNKVFLISLGQMIATVTKVAMQAVGAIWNLLAPMRWIVTHLMNAISAIGELIMGFASLMNDTPLGRLINKFLTELGGGNERGGFQVNEVQTTAVGYQGHKVEGGVVNPAGLEYILGVTLDEGLIGNMRRAVAGESTGSGTGGDQDFAVAGP